MKPFQALQACATTGCCSTPTAIINPGNIIESVVAGHSAKPLKVIEVPVVMAVAPTVKNDPFAMPVIEMVGLANGGGAPDS